MFKYRERVRLWQLIFPPPPSPRQKIQSQKKYFKFFFDFQGFLFILIYDESSVNDLILTAAKKGHIMVYFLHLFIWYAQENPNPFRYFIFKHIYISLGIPRHALICCVEKINKRESITREVLFHKSRNISMALSVRYLGLCLPEENVTLSLL